MHFFVLFSYSDGADLVVHSVHISHSVTQLIHEYHVDIPWISVPSRRFRGTRGVENIRHMMCFFTLCSSCTSLIVVVVVVLVVLVLNVALNSPPPLVLIVLMCLGGMCLGDMLGKALAPLNCCGIAETGLLMGGVGGIRACAADVDGLLFVFLANAPPLRVMFPLAVGLATSSPPDCRRCCGDGVNLVPRFLIRHSPRQANPLLVVNELVHDSSKELEAACRPVVCRDNLLEKTVGVNTNNAKR